MSPLALLALVLVFYFLPALGLARLFKKAGEAPAKAFIPLYRSIVMLRLANRPWYLAILQLIPVLGMFFTVAIWIEFLRTFGKTRFDQYVLVPVTAGLYFLYLGYSQKTAYTRPQETRKFSRADVRNRLGLGILTIGLLLWPLSFVFVSYSIPTASMEKTLLRGDWLLVGRYSYGLRTLQPDYHRSFPSPVKRGDVIVFNFPEGDTVINLPEFQSMRPYYEVCRALGKGNIDSGRQIVLGNPEEYPLAIKSIEEEVAYLKRVVATPGDKLEIRNMLLYIDGKPEPLPPGSQTYFRVQTNGQPLDEETLKQTYGVDINDPDEFQTTDKLNQYEIQLSWSARENMLKDGLARSIDPDIDTTRGETWPYDSVHAWTRDNFGPVWVPQKGAALVLTPENYFLYERVIRTYEGNQLEMKAGKIYINGKEENRYRFKMDYYWVMGDALHGSQDSRYYGFVPEDHVIGKAGFILFSWNKGMRWNRLCKAVE